MPMNVKTARFARETGAYGVAMDWKPHDRAQIDAMDDDEEEFEAARR